MVRFGNADIRMKGWRQKCGQADLAKLASNESYCCITALRYPLKDLIKPNDRVGTAQAEADVFKMIANMHLMKTRRR